MKKDIMYIFFFIFSLLALSVWNSGYLGLFGLSFSKPLGSNNNSDPTPNRQKRHARRSRNRRRELETAEATCIAINLRHVLLRRGYDRDRLLSGNIKLTLT